MNSSAWVFKPFILATETDQSGPGFPASPTLHIDNSQIHPIHHGRARDKGLGRTKARWAEQTGHEGKLGERQAFRKTKLQIAIQRDRNNNTDQTAQTDKTPPRKSKPSLLSNSPGNPKQNPVQMAKIQSQKSSKV